jgi:hypothetical protein
MEQDPFFNYGPNGRAVAVILAQCAEMTLVQVAAAAKANDSVTGYLGISRSWRDATRAAQLAAEGHPRTRFLTAAKDAAMNGVMRAVQRIVASNGKSDAGIGENWQDYLSATAEPDPRRRQRAYRNLQRALNGAIGSKAAKSVPVASGAASTAAQVAVVWDLASERGPFTPAHRDLLMSPWLTVFPLPPDFAG